MADEYDPKLAEWTERLNEGESGAAAARDSLFDVVCAALGATPAELAEATRWSPRSPARSGRSGSGAESLRNRSRPMARAARWR